MRRFLAASAALLLVTTLGSAQSRVIEIGEGFSFTQEGIELTRLTGDMTPSVVGPAATGAGSQRLEKLKALIFDRRPSAILEAWSTPPPEPEPEPEPESEGEPSEAEEEPAETAAPEEEVPAESAESARSEGQVVLEEEAIAEERSELDGESEGDEPEDGPPAESAIPEKTPEELQAEAEAEAKRLEAEAKALELELKLFQRSVTLGQWDEVRDYLAGLTEEESKAGYQQLLKSMAAGPPQQVRNQFTPYAEKNFFAPEDVTGLVAAAPGELEDDDLTSLATILRRCVDAGSLIERCIVHLKESRQLEDFPLSATQAARLVLESGHPIDAGEFLPEPEVAIADNDRAVLNMLSRHYLALEKEDAKAGYLEKAWQVTQAVLADGEVADEDKKEALKRAVEIAPRIQEELGQAWLEESFTARPERGMEILSVIGAAASQGLFTQARNSSQRLKSLELQTTAAEALLEAAPERALEWKPTLNLLATNWLNEAVFTYQNDLSTQRGPGMQRDVYGNFYYYNFSNRSINNNRPKPLTTADVLEIRPSDDWLSKVEESLAPKFAMVTAQLLLKVNEESEAFPYIEDLAQIHPERATELVEEFLRVWARNHNPNSTTNRTNPYMFVYGFEQRANAIPLTRSKQERNLIELAEWVTRLRALPIEDIDEELIASAFTAAHSTAEVYRVETIERVFGELDLLDPKTLAELVQKMRSNLVGVWREPTTQKDQNTRRRRKDIENEVVRGYEVATAVIESAMAGHPEEWSLALAHASVLHDENNYRQEIAKSSEFAGKREEAFQAFQRAADLYAAQLDELDQEEETASPYITWFYASLGACDLAAIDHEKQPVQRQLELIRKALDGLPGEAAERHRGLFANLLFTRMSNANPAVKFNYVRSGLEIVGEHERSTEVREIYEYYADLVTEIRLETRIDGADRVGEEPFGMFIDLRHTREIEREAGGFSKYLTNQNNQGFAYNYGRPTENYRDKFEEAAREVLDEHFEILSLTFNHPESNSRAVEEYGWRVTPYAYALLKPRGPEIDRVPPLRLDLDFLDTTGYAILPVESSPLPIDASGESTLRPYGELRVTQTLDERQADDGKLLLEVKATAAGLVPAWDAFLDLKTEGFRVDSVDDQGVSVSEFDAEADDTMILSERTWMVSFKAEDELEELPSAFRFGEAREDIAEMTYQRFVDADLESVAATIDLEASYGERVFPWTPVLFAGLLLIAGLGGFVVWRRRAARPTLKRSRDFEVPDTFTPFTVIGLLRQIEANNGVSPEQRNTLLQEIESIEACYFENDGSDAPDLQTIAETWVRRLS